MILKYVFLQNELKNIIQSSELNIGEVYLILRDIYRDIEILYNKQIELEIEDSKNTEQESEE